MISVSEFMYHPDLTLPWSTRLGEIILWKTATFDVEAICVAIDPCNPYCQYVVSHIANNIVQRMYNLRLYDLMAFAREANAFAHEDARVVWYSQVRYVELVRIANKCRQENYASTAITAYQEHDLRRSIWYLWSAPHIVFCKTHTYTHKSIHESV